MKKVLLFWQNYCEVFPVCCETFPKTPFAVKWRRTPMRISPIYQDITDSRYSKTLYGIKKHTPGGIFYPKDNLAKMIFVTRPLFWFESNPRIFENSEDFWKSFLNSKWKNSERSAEKFWFCSKIVKFLTEILITWVFPFFFRSQIRSLLTNSHVQYFECNFLSNFRQSQSFQAEKRAIWGENHVTTFRALISQ